MTWKKGQSGNPLGRIGSEKEFSEAIRMASKEIDPVTRKLNNRVIADKVVELAKKGEAWAINIYADRLEGKPVQEPNVTITNKHDRTDWTWNELIAFIDDSRKKSGNGAEGEISGEPESDSVH
jgi:hypothetical protein